MKPILVLCLLAALGLATVAAAETVTLTPTQDNTLYESPTGDFSNGAGRFLFAGVTNQGFLRRAVLAFDVAANLPANVVITSASLTLEMSASHENSHPVRIHRVLAAWGEGTSDAALQEGMGADSTTGDATWIHTFFNTSSWTAPGGDFVTPASATQLIGVEGPYTWASTPELVADVQWWLDAPEENFGWMLIGRENVTPSTKRFNSRDHTEEATRPRLVVEYVVPVFRDRFESGDTSGWSSTVPLQP